uniref:NADH-ubiquinone oxidoreductase chain 3 n=1 Tax=Ameiurus melas TaxID=219545 RepID=A0A0S3H8B6_AMEME|nr:NADH dehydrogenase subunit 3 [Ameiurus melas]
MNLIMVVTLITLILTTIQATVSFWRPQKTPGAQMVLPLQCRYHPLGSARLALAVRFLLVASLFLLFEVEIALLLPLPWANHLQSRAYTLLSAATILILLTLGLIYEGVQAGVEWAE